MFRLNSARMPRIKTRAVAARQSGLSIGPEPKTPFRTQPKPQLELIPGGKPGKSEGEKEFGKRKLCTFCENEFKAQDEDDLLEWRRGAAIFFEHLPNPDREEKMRVDEDIRMDSGICEGYNYRGDKSF
ncbi:MAG: hypothetical protein GY852_04130 [bacterium]|nr:hypothetical protein [bacterium]